MDLAFIEGALLLKWAIVLKWALLLKVRTTSEQGQN
jgi:hypothetical protein